MYKSKIVLSFIVPMYKVAPYVDRCMRSLLEQDVSLENYEIICINDGSPDNSAELVQKWQKDYTNIVLINQENQGVSIARNMGIQRAQGKYIIPIDADDYIASNSLGKVLLKLEREDLDVLYLSFAFLENHGNVIYRSDYSKFETDIDSGYEGYFKVRGMKVKAPDRSCGILYRRELLIENQVFYPKNVPYLEDGLFLGKVFQVAQRVGYSNEDFYYYLTREGSATNSKLFVSDKALVGFKNAVMDLLDFYQQIKHRSPNADKLFNRILVKYVFLGFTNVRQKNNRESFRAYSDFLVGLGLGKLPIETKKGIYAVLARYYNISWKLLYILMPIRMKIYKKINW